MPYDLVGKLLLLSSSLIFVISSLLTIGRKKRHYRIYPDPVKKEFYKVVRIATIANTVAGALIVGAVMSFHSNYSLLLFIVALFVSIGGLYVVLDDLSEE